MAQLLLTLIGDDREGLVNELSTAVADNGGNWLESQMARLGGSFAGIALVDVPDDKVDTLKSAVEGFGDLHVTVSPAGEDTVTTGTPLTVHLVGNDHPGIVRQVTLALASQGITIDEMQTRTRPAPMADTVLFEATAQVRLPEDADPAAVRDSLESLANELMVDFDFDESLEQGEARA